MLERMPSAELTEWAAFFSLEPFGEVRADFRFGALMALTANISRKKGSKAYKPQDFMPTFGQEKPTGQDLLAKVEMINTMFKGKDKRKR